MAKAEEELKLGLASKVALEADYPWLSTWFATPFELAPFSFKDMLPILNAYAAVLRRIERAQAVLEEKK